MAVDLANLVVRMEANSAALIKELEKARADVKKFGRQTAVTTSAAATAFGTLASDAAKALGRMAISAIDSADQVSKLAQSTGVSTEALSRLQFAAELSGGSLDTLRDGFNKLNKSASDAARGTGGAQAAFASLGVSVTDANGKVKDSETLLLDVADAFAKYGDGAGKSAAAQAIFGESGARLIPFLNNGRAGLAALGDEAERAGLVLSGPAGKAAEAFNDDLDRMRKVGEGVVLQIVQQLLPTISNISAKFVSGANDARGYTSGINIISGAVKGLVTAGTIVSGVLTAAGQALGGLAAAAVQFVSGQFRQSFATLQQLDSDIVADVRETVDSVAAIWSDSAPDMTAAAATAGAALVNGVKPQLQLLAPETKKAAKEVRDSITPMLEALQFAAATVGMTDAETELYRLTLEGASAAQLDLARSALATVAAWERQQEASEAARQAEMDRIAALEGMQSRHLDLITGTTAAQRDFAQAQEDLTTLLGAGRLSADEYAAAMQRLKDSSEGARDGIFDVAEFGKEAARNLQSAFADFLFDPFSDGLDGMLKGFGQVLQRMIAEAVAADLLGRLQGLGSGTSGGGFGGVLGAIGSFAGLFDAGGRIGSGEFGIVGERGPELVFGGASVVGREDTAALMAGGGNNIVVNVSPQNNSADMRRAAGLGAREALGAINQARRYG